MYKCKQINKRRSRKKLIIIISIIVAIFSVGWFIQRNINPIITTVSKEEVRALTNKAVNYAAMEVLNGSVSYSDLLIITKDNEGNISLIQANTVLINSLARKTTYEAQKSIDIIGKNGIDIPIGSLSGISFLAGKGPSISLKIMPIGSITCKFSSEFISAGINQTKHKIFMDVIADVSVIIPGASKSITTHTEILVSENIIVGKVPDTYLQSNNIDEMLNLVP